MIKPLLKRLAAMAGYRVLLYRGNYHEDGLFTYHSDAFRRDPRFAAAYRRGLKTVPSNPGHEWRAHIATWCASVAARLEGDFVECGVYVGFMSSTILSYLDWDVLGKRLWLIDTFEGPSKEQLTPGEVEAGRARTIDDLKRVGGYDYDVDSVRENFAEWPRVEIVKGLVPEVLGQCGAEKVAYLHIDMNASVPETASLRHFWDRMVPGGVILLDDYCYLGFEEQRLAMDQVASELGFEIAFLPTGQGLILKPPAKSAGAS